MNKTVRLGTAQTSGGLWYSVYCQIKIVDGKLSITGVEGPTLSGNAYGSCGQIGSHLKAINIKAAPGWSQAKIQRFLEIWQRWHLNDMRAGSPRQEAYLREHPTEFKYPQTYFEQAKSALMDAGLQPDYQYPEHSSDPNRVGYSYGSAWLTEPLPPDVVAWLEVLPEADKTPAWV